MIRNRVEKLAEAISRGLKDTIELYQDPPKLDSVKEVDEYMQEIDYEALSILIGIYEDMRELKNIILKEISPELWASLLHKVGEINDTKSID